MEWFFNKGKTIHDTIYEREQKLLNNIDNLENQMLAKNIQIQILTHKFNNQCATIFRMKSKNSELTERLKLHEEVVEDYTNISKTFKRDSSCPNYKTGFSYNEKLSVLDKVEIREKIKKNLKQVRMDETVDTNSKGISEGEITNKQGSNKDIPMLVSKSSKSPEKNKSIKAKIDSYKFNKYTPINPDELFLKVFNFDQEIRKNDPDIYLKIKEFSLQDESDINITSIEKFAKMINQDFSKRKTYYSCINDENKLNDQQIYER